MSHWIEKKKIKKKPVQCVTQKLTILEGRSTAMLANVQSIIIMIFLSLINAKRLEKYFIW